MSWISSCLYEYNWMGRSFVELLERERIVFDFRFAVAWTELSQFSFSRSIVCFAIVFGGSVKKSLNYTAKKITLIRVIRKTRTRTLHIHNIQTVIKCEKMIVRMNQTVSAMQYHNYSPIFKEKPQLIIISITAVVVWKLFNWLSLFVTISEYFTPHHLCLTYSLTRIQSTLCVK